MFSMRKRYKIINIALISMLLSGGAPAYSADITCLRVPVGIDENRVDDAISYSDSPGDYIRLRHQIDAILYGIYSHTDKIWPPEGTEFREAYSVFWKIEDEFRKGGDITIKKEYKQRDINIYECLDIMREKLLVFHKKAEQLVSRGVTDIEVLDIYSATWQVCELIDKYARGIAPKLCPLHIHPLLILFKDTEEIVVRYKEIHINSEDVVIMGSVIEFWEVFEQLLENAKKHGNAKNCYIDVRRKDRNVIITFRDDGIGMPKEALARNENGIPRAFLGFSTTSTGLGLPIVYRIITDIWGGKIDVQSEPNKGTTFTMTLPYVNEEILNEKLTAILLPIDL